MVNKGAIVLGGVGLSLIPIIIWSVGRRKETNPLENPELAPQEATQQSSVYLNTIAAKYSDDSSLANHIEQAINTIALNAAQGISPSEDPGAAIFSGQLKAYEAYRADGGTESFEDFSVYNAGMTPEYRAIIDAAKDAYNKREAASIMDSAGYTTDGYGNITGVNVNYIQYRINLLGEDNPVNQEILSLPEVQEALGLGTPSPEEVQAAVAPSPPGNFTSPEPDDEPFVASVSQLDTLVSSGINQDSDEYEAAIDSAYQNAANEAEASDGQVAWSSDQGYYVISEEEAYSYYDDYWY